MLKKKTVLAACATMLSSMAHASDQYIPTKVADWSGAYIGILTGFSANRIDNPIGSKSSEVSALNGIVLGYNYQIGKYVLGAETDFQFVNINHDFGNGIKHGSFVDDLVKGSQKVKYFGTVGGRLGYEVLDNVLIYGTAGLAYGKVKDKFIANYYHVYNLGRSKTKLGYAFGAGIDYAINNNWVIKTEYIYANLGTFKSEYFNINGSEGQQTAKRTYKNDMAIHNLRLGVSYKF